MLSLTNLLHPPVESSMLALSARNFVISSVSIEPRPAWRDNLVAAATSLLVDSLEGNMHEVRCGIDSHVKAGSSSCWASVVHMAPSRVSACTWSAFLKRFYVPSQGCVYVPPFCACYCDLRHRWLSINAAMTVLRRVSRSTTFRRRRRMIALD